MHRKTWKKRRKTNKRVERYLHDDHLKNDNKLLRSRLCREFDDVGSVENFYCTLNMVEMVLREARIEQILLNGTLTET